MFSHYSSIFHYSLREAFLGLSCHKLFCNLAVQLGHVVSLLIYALMLKKVGKYGSEILQSQKEPWKHACGL